MQKSVGILPRTVLTLRRMVIYCFSYPSYSTIMKEDMFRKIYVQEGDCRSMMTIHRKNQERSMVGSAENIPWCLETISYPFS